MKLFVFATHEIGVAFLQVILLFVVPILLVALVRSIMGLLRNKDHSTMYYHKK